MDMENTAMQTVMSMKENTVKTALPAKALYCLLTVLFIKASSSMASSTEKAATRVPRPSWSTRETFSMEGKKDSARAPSKTKNATKELSRTAFSKEKDNTGSRVAINIKESSASDSPMGEELYCMPTGTNMKARFLEVCATEREPFSTRMETSTSETLSWVCNTDSENVSFPMVMSTKEAMRKECVMAKEVIPGLMEVTTPESTFTTSALEKVSTYPPTHTCIYTDSRDQQTFSETAITL